MSVSIHNKQIETFMHYINVEKRVDTFGLFQSQAGFGSCRTSVLGLPSSRMNVAVGGGLQLAGLTISVPVIMINVVLALELTAL